MQRLSLTLAVAALAASAHAAAPPSVGRDRHGDLLPPSGLARLGSERLRTGGSGGLAVSPDSKTVATGEPGLVRLWDAASGRERAALDVPDSGNVSWLEFTPDGKHLVAQAGRPLGTQPLDPLAGNGESLFVLSLSDGKVVHHLKPTSSGGFLEPRLLDGGKRVVAWHGLDFGRNSTFGGRRRSFGTLRGWSLPAGKELFALELLAMPADVAVSPDGKTLAFCNTNDGHVELWPLPKGDRIDRLPPPEKRLERLAYEGYLADSVRFTEDGKRLVVGYSAESLVNLSPNVLTQVWGVADRLPVGPPTRELQRRTALAHLGDLSPDGTWWARADRDGVRLVEAKTGRARAKVAASGGTSNLTFSPDGRTLWANAANPFSMDSVRAWKVPSGEEAFPRTGHANAVRRIAFADGGVVATADDGHRLRLWKADGEALPTPGPDKAFRWSVSPDGKALSALGEDGMLRVWDVPSRRLARSFRVISRLSPRLWLPIPDFRAGRWGESATAVFDPTGKWLAFAELDGRVVLYELATGKSKRLSVKTNESSPLVFSPDGQTLATWEGSSFGLSEVFNPRFRALSTLHLWSVADGKQVARVQGVPEVPPAFSPDGGRVATVNHLGAAQLYDLRGKSPVVWKNQGPMPEDERFFGLALFGQEAAFLADGESLLTPAFGGEVAVRDAATGNVLRKFRVTQSAVHRTAAGPMLAAADEAGKATLFDPRNGRALARLDGGISSICVALSPDGRVLAVADGRQVRLHEMLSGGEVGRLAGGHRGPVTALAFSEGGALATGGVDTTALTWDWRRACGVGGETDDETAWADLGGDDARLAWAAMERFVRRDGAAFLAKKVKPFGDAERAKLGRLCEALDDDDFDVRQKAIGELDGMGSEWLPLVRDVMDKRPALEVVLRLRRWREGTAAKDFSSEMRGRLRAVWVLERLGTPAAREALRSLEAGFPTADLTREAKAASRRLAGREGK